LRNSRRELSRSTRINVSGTSVCLNFRGLFRAIDEGNAGLNIPAYNGGLFALDESLDGLQVPDEVCAHFKDLGDYDYRATREVADADENTEVRSVIDVDIFGHIFERSTTDLERLRLSLAERRAAALPLLKGAQPANSWNVVRFYASSVNLLMLRPLSIPEVRTLSRRNIDAIQPLRQIVMDKLVERDQPIRR
jgi:hypothetical protein